MPRLHFLRLLVMLVLGPVQAWSLPTVQAVRERDNITLPNDAISATWSIRDAPLHWATLINHFTRTTLPLAGSVFALVPKEGPVLHSSDLKVVAAPVIEDAGVSKDSSKAADHLPGRQVRIELEDPSANLHLTWTAILRDGANYIRQEVTLRALQPSFAPSQIVLIDAVVPGAAVSGHAKGSPVTAGTWFLGFEHPLSECRVHADRASCWLARELPLQAGQRVTYSSVIGVTHASQLRRDFLNYVELERAHPYRTFLHYNSWYDLGFFGCYDEQSAVAVVQSFGEELTKRRGVKLDSFLFDDSWDGWLDESCADRRPVRRGARNLAFAGGEATTVQNNSAWLRRTRKDSKPTKAGSRSPAPSTIAISATHAST
jgi:hypothetical protein